MINYIFINVCILGARSLAASSARTRYQRLHLQLRLLVRTLSGLSVALLVSLIPLEAVLVLHSGYAHLLHRRSISDASIAAKAHWTQQKQKLSPVFGVHMGLVCTSIACCIFGAACLALRVCCRRRTPFGASKRPQLSQRLPSENNIEVSASQPNAVQTEGEVHVKIEQICERERDPSSGVQALNPRDSSSLVDETNREAKGTLRPLNTEERSSPSFTFIVYILDSLMLWAAVYTIRIACLALEMDAALQHMQHFSTPALIPFFPQTRQLLARALSSNAGQ